jgi:hypothetical protein
MFGKHPQPSIEERKPMYLSYVMQVASILQPNEDSDQLLLDQLSTSVPPGNAFPLFNNWQTNLVESEANAAGVSGVRNANPPNETTLWIRRASNVMAFIIGLRLYSASFGGNKFP